MRLYLFDDRVADGWAPFALTRPCSELLFGDRLLRRRLERYAGTPAAGLMTRPWLGAYREEETPPVVDRSIREQEERLFLCSRFVPAAGARFEPPERASTLWIEGEAVGAWLPAEVPGPEPAWFRQPEALPGTGEVELAGDLLSAAWELISRNPDRLEADLAARAGGPDAPPPVQAPPRGAEIVGGGRVELGGDVRVEPGVLIDTREGPVCLDEGVEVLAGTRLSGPLYAGRSSRLLGGALATVSAGPRSYLRGEVESTVVWGYSNKAHDGYLGHSYVGRWVNLGALTTNSDLKNNYRPVRIPGPEGEEVQTGLLKLGCLVGDHVKTGIGMLLNTGTLIGAGSNLFGEMPPRRVPPFSWGGGETLGTHRKEQFLRTAEVVAGRRGVPFDETTRRWLGAVWEAGRAPSG
ncbi:MAG: putative sugar nucleotidyl transferase [Gemmatimonadota bacterium]